MIGQQGIPCNAFPIGSSWNFFTSFAGESELIVSGKSNLSPLSGLYRPSQFVTLVTSLMAVSTPPDIADGASPPAYDDVSADSGGNASAKVVVQARKDNSTMDTVAEFNGSTGDAKIAAQNGAGIILAAPNGTLYKITVTNAGAINVASA